MFFTDVTVPRTLTVPLIVAVTLDPAGKLVMFTFICGFTAPLVNEAVAPPVVLITMLDIVIPEGTVSLIAPELSATKEELFAVIV
ncbi:hypothetical protein D3C85_1614220 [compost metagenome]